MATQTFVAAQDVEARDLIKLTEASITDTDVIEVPTGFVTALADAEVIDQFNVRILTSEGMFVIDSTDELPYAGVSEDA